MAAADLGFRGVRAELKAARVRESGAAREAAGFKGRGGVPWRAGQAVGKGGAQGSDPSSSRVRRGYDVAAGITDGPYTSAAAREEANAGCVGPERRQGLRLAGLEGKARASDAEESREQKRTSFVALMQACERPRGKIRVL
jgi:hypothetical protein